MDSSQIWKPILIVAVLAIAAVALYPLDTRLKPGLDLAGGTVFTYQVEVKQGDDAKTVVNSVIDVISRRVDPSGVRNLVWLPLAGNRIEIRVPLAPKQTVGLRKKFIAAHTSLVQSNLRLGQLDAAMRMGTEQRGAQLETLSKGNDELRSRLDAMAEAFATLQEATTAFDAVEAQLSEARKATDEAKVAELAARIAPLFAAEQAAQQSYQAARDVVLEWNVDTAEFESLKAPVDDWRGLKQVQRHRGEATFRQVLEDLVLAHPDKQDQLHAVADAFFAYSKVKGPLDDPKDLIALLRGAGVIEFRIGPAPDEVPDLDAYRKRLKKQGPLAGSSLPYRWFAIDDINQFADNDRERKNLNDSPEEYFAGYGRSGESSRGGLIGQRYRDDYFLLMGNTLENSITEATEDWKLTNARYAADRNMLPAVSFKLNTLGGSLMQALTSPDERKGMPLAIVLDGHVISAPSIQSTLGTEILISSGAGGFSAREQQYLVNTLNAGTLKARLSPDPISVNHIGPKLGQDNLTRGFKAAVWALIIVAVFMAAYYLFAGFVADFALMANMVLILGTMATLQATFTLPGIAGIVLTIGMAVDANVLIFERIREELAQKADLRTAVRVGYGKALVTIIDANLTTLITCLILGYTATAEVKGFAVTLGIGIVATLFTALFCTKVIVELAMNVASMRSLPMLPTLVPAIGRLLHPNLNWIGNRRVFFSASVLIMAVGVVIIFSRGADLLDIEFRAGTKVSFGLKEGQTLALQEVRDRLNEHARRPDEQGNPTLPELTREEGPSIVTLGETTVKGSDVLASSFSVACLSLDQQKVSELVKNAFGDVLEAEVPLAFAGAGRDGEPPHIREAREFVRPVLEPVLGANIDRADVLFNDVSDFLGGVAVRLDAIEPPVSVEQLRDRISRMRLSPRFEHLPFRNFEVIGIDLASGTGATDEYTSAVVVVAADEQSDYRQNLEPFYTDALGLASTEWQLIHEALRRDTSLESVSNFSPQVSSTMKTRATVAMILSLLAVVAYIWLRFGSLRYGLAAIAALVHDVVIAMGLVAICGLAHDTVIGHALGLSDFKINLAMVAAMLTIIGYSLNDTIVIFDRVRENRGRLATATPAILNDSINQTISRTVLTSGTTLLAVLTLYIFGGEGIHGFAFAMLVGVVVGTYSSIGIAAPLLLVGQQAEKPRPEGSQGSPATV